MVNQRLYDRDNRQFEVLKKKIMLEAEEEAFGQERPEMKMGRRQVERPEKKQKDQR